MIVPELNGKPMLLTMKISILPKNAKVYGSKSLKMNNNDRKEIYDIYQKALEKLEFQSMSSEERFNLMVESYRKYHKVISKLVKL